MKQNTPDREVQGVMCLLARDTDAFATEATRTQFLTRRGVPLHRCGLIGSLYFGEPRHED